MAQQRFFNYKDDDLTWTLSRETLTLHKPGLYAGFDAVLGPSMVLTLNHANTGLKSYSKTHVADAAYGVVISRQGTIVREDSSLTFNIAANAGEARFDLIYMEHEYMDVQGGVAAVFGLVQGTPAASSVNAPLHPALPNPAKQVAIGALYIPAGTTTSLASAFYYRLPYDYLLQTHDAATSVSTGIPVYKNPPYALVTPNDGVNHLWEIEWSFNGNFTPGSGDMRILLFDVNLPATLAGPSIFSKTGNMESCTRKVRQVLTANKHYAHYYHNNSIGSLGTFSDVYFQARILL